MITQKLLDDIKSHEEFFFSIFRVPQTLSSPSPSSSAPNKNGGKETPLLPSQVDKVVKKALNQLKAKQDLIKKRNSGLTAEAAKAAKAGAGKGKRKASEGEAGGAPGAAGAKKKKKVDKQDKKERRKVDLKGRSAKKDAKNKAIKEGNQDDAPEVAISDDADGEAAIDGNDAAKSQAKEQFIFGKIETATGSKEGKKQVGKDFKRHLKTLQEEKSKIAAAKGEDQEKGEELEEKFAWKNVMQKAQGVKVKDDEGLIKKSIKRKENIKKQSQKKWEKREKEVKDKMAEKQKKRTANIRAKKDEKIKKKVKKMTKKGRLVPGLNAPE